MGVYGITLYKEAGGNIWYCDPAGTTATAAGLQASNPSTIAYALSLLRSGDTIMLADGTYNEAIAAPADIIYVDIRAITSGGVLIDGEGVRVPVTLEQTGWKLAGINAANSSGSVFVITGDNCTVSNCVGWDAADNGNYHIFSLFTGNGSLLVDCAGFGIARKIFSISSGATNAIVRRCFGIWEGYTGENGPTMTYTMFYNSRNTKYEYCIGMRNRHRVVSAPDQPTGVFSVDNAGGGSEDTNNSVTQCVAIVRDGDILDAPQAVYWTDYNQIELINLVAVVEGDHTGYLRSVMLANVNAEPPAISASRVTGIGADGIVTGSDWAGHTSNLLEATTIATAYGEGETIWNTASGAQLDSSVFLAWPMRQRIIDAMTTAGYAAGNIIDVHAELIAIFGEA